MSEPYELEPKKLINTYPHLLEAFRRLPPSKGVEYLETALAEAWQATTFASETELKLAYAVTLVIQMLQALLPIERLVAEVQAYERPEHDAIIYMAGLKGHRAQLVNAMLDSSGVPAATDPVVDALSKVEWVIQGNSVIGGLESGTFEPEKSDVEAAQDARWAPQTDTVVDALSATVTGRVDGMAVDPNGDLHAWGTVIAAPTEQTQASGNVLIATDGLWRPTHLPARASAPAAEDEPQT